MPLVDVNDRFFNRPPDERALREDDLNSEGFFQRAVVGGKEALKFGPTAALGQVIRNTAEGIFSPTPKEDFISGAEANEQYGLTDTDQAFEPDEQVTYDDADMRENRMREVDTRQRLDAAAREDGKWVGASDFVGGLVGGFLDPINLAAGAGVSIGLGKAAMLARSAVNSTTAPTALRLMQGSVTKGADWLLKQKNLSSRIMHEAMEGFIGGVAVDVPATMYVSNRYGEEFNASAAAQLILASTVFSSAMPVARNAFGAVKNKAIPPGRKILEHVRQKGHQGLAALKRKAGSDLETYATELSAWDTISKREGGEVDVRATQDGFEDIAWIDRDADEIGVEHLQVLEVADLQGKEFHVGSRSGEGSYRKVADYGAGTVTLVDRKSMAKNSVQDVEGQFGGNVQTVMLRNPEKVMVKSDFDANRAAIVDSVLEGVETSAGNAAKARDALTRAESLDEFTDVLEALGVVPDAQIRVNEAIQGLGYEGFHVEMSHRDGAKANALVLFDMNPKQKLYTQSVGDGALRLDESRMSVEDVETVAKADMENPTLKRLKEEQADRLNQNLDRLKEGATDDTPGRVEADEITAEVAKTEEMLVEEQLEVFEENLDVLESQLAEGDIDPEILKQHIDVTEERALIAEVKQRSQNVEKDMNDFIKCALGVPDE